MEIEEKEGKYYLKLSNGELEISKDQALRLVKERGAKLKNNFQEWVDVFHSRQMTATSVPKTADDYLYAENFYNKVLHEFEEMYDKNQNKKDIAEKMIDFCKEEIINLDRQKENAKDIPFNEYKSLNWLRVLNFIQALTNTYED